MTAVSYTHLRAHETKATYDRKVIKMNEAKVREINQQICNSLNK